MADEHVSRREVLTSIAVTGLGSLSLEPVAGMSDDESSGDANIASGLGITEVDGKDVVVDVVVEVAPDETEEEAINKALEDQGARPYDAAALGSEGFTLIRFAWDSGAFPVGQHYNPGSSHTETEPLPSKESLKNTHVTWNGVTTSKFEFTYEGTTTRCPSLVRECHDRQHFDGHNDVAWVNLDERILGVAWHSTEPDEPDEVDIALNPRKNWVHDENEEPGDGNVDIETVMLHENGHGVGLGHSSFREAVMYPVHQGGKRTLFFDDEEGTTYLYDKAVMGKVSGTVTDSIASPIADATVEIVGTDDDIEETKRLFDTTSTNGDYSIGNIPDPVTYDITASADGFGSKTKTRITVDGSKDGVDFMLGDIIAKLGHTLLKPTPEEFAEATVRDDGDFAVVGSNAQGVGTFLVDLTTLTDPQKMHHLSATGEAINRDVKFDSRDGLYYRTEEDISPTRDFGVEIIDYGHSTGTASHPVIASRIDAGPTHNVFPHPKPGVHVLYAVNAHSREGPGLEIWDVSDPKNPVSAGTAGPKGALHDVVIDPVKDHIHCAYIAGDFEGYALLDGSKPKIPRELARFDYSSRHDYERVGVEGFENAHYADYDPERDIVVVGDEKPIGIPGGKHILDISDPESPTSVGFTHSPNAEPQDELREAFDWTGHNFDVIPSGRSPTGRTLLVSGDYHEGMVVYDIDDPTSPTALDQYKTDDGSSGGTEAPMAWDADYVRTQSKDVVVTSDKHTGFYTFELHVS